MADLVELADVKDYLNIKREEIDFDNLLKGLISGVSEEVQTVICREVFINTEYTETRDGNGAASLVLDHSPITADITSIVISETAVTSSYIKTYKKDGRVVLTSGVFTEGTQNIVITYTAGYGADIANLPADLKLGVKKLIKAEYLSSHVANINIPPEDMGDMVSNTRKEGLDILKGYINYGC